MASRSNENDETKPLPYLPKVKSAHNLNKKLPLPPLDTAKKASHHNTHFWKNIRCWGISTADLKYEKKRKDDIILGRRGGYTFLALTALLMIASTVLISSSIHILNVRPCELKTALDSIFLNYAPHPCKYNAIKEMCGGLQLITFGSVELFWNVFSFLVVLRICMWESTHRKLGFTILYIVLGFVALIFLVTSLVLYIQLMQKIAGQMEIDYVNLQSAMKYRLSQQYSSDNMSSMSKESNAWNNFFFQYDCCAVQEVLGTTNDFDNTPWCTTNGSCQATASQIPKTCCKGVTPDDYQTAPSTCHASVNGGTFKLGCIDRMRALSNVNIDECQVTVLSLSLFTLVILQLLEVFLVLLIFLILCIHSKRTNQTVSPIKS
uniref:Uncharacterized protein LOC111126645 isoform X1 n=1 Tax=Crassostrea virginica TaxID=6565 RepID=A0A8B8DHF9_CRAVI|nr:uncharacterized protein LOC111126645 isoform X1 [Crassostrea virginica]XP_022327135.1 uncharacterized protein LOC111126645 isoform X1 [Crassostrea virginica]